jgi:hypothetical protein
MSAARAKKLDELVGSVEELLAQLPDNLTPEVAALRDRVDAGIFEAWTVIASEAASARRVLQLRRSAPLWVNVGIAALVAGATSLLAFRMASSTVS